MRNKKKISRRLMSPVSCALESLESRLFLTAAPTGVVANNGSTPTDIVVSWNTVSGASGYQVWRNTVANTSTATDIAPNASGTSFDDTNVTVGTNYFYWVVTTSGSGNSGFSDPANAVGGTLVFNDTFGTSSTISSAWGAENATDPNNGNVHYTNTQPAQATASNPATLQLVSDPNATDGQALAMSLLPAPGKSGTYYSAEISTKVDPSGIGNSLEYGEITARIKIPGGNNSAAIWPAFWMLGDNISQVGWPKSGEIDIMENDGAHPGTIASHIHGPMSNGTDYNGGAGVGADYTLSGGQDFYSSYHTFSVNWGPNSITWSVDGVAFETVTPASIPGGSTWVFNGHPFYIILDVCEGGNFAPGTITSTQTMYVDDVRAYSFPAPTTVAATVASSSTHAQVSWSAVTGATSYEVWRSSSSDVTTATELNASVSGVTYTDTTATAGTSYYYWVAAANSAQTSGYSASVLSTTRQTPTVALPSAPSNIGYDGLSDVTNWVTPTLTGVNGFPAPTGSPTLVYYSGTTATGQPLASSPINLGTYTVVAQYAGDSNYLAAQSAPLTFTIGNPTGLSTGAGATYAVTWSGATPTLNVTNGVVTLTADLSTTFANYVLSVQNGASVMLASDQNVGQVNLSGSGSLDIQSFSVVVHYNSGSDPMGTIVGWINGGYAGGTWTGVGILSSAAAGSPTTYGIGYADASDSGNPASLAFGTLKFQYALLGDANLDGSVNGTDFALLGANFGAGGTRWDEGDFNYDGTTNGSDFSALAGNFGKSSNAPALALAAVAQSQTAVTGSVTSGVKVAATPASQLTSAVTPAVNSSATVGRRHHHHKR
jgi:beta-glucanase (GH16 family)